MLVNYDKKYGKSIEKDYLVKGFSTLDLMKIADYIITDYSAVSFEDVFA